MSTTSYTPSTSGFLRLARMTTGWSVLAAAPASGTTARATAVHTTSTAEATTPASWGRVRPKGPVLPAERLVPRPLAVPAPAAASLPVVAPAAPPLLAAASSLAAAPFLPSGSFLPGQGRPRPSSPCEKGFSTSS